MNHVTVTIADQDYTLLTDGEAAFTQKVAAHVDQKVTEMLDAKVSRADSAILACMNIAEEYFLEQATSDNLRLQMKEALEEAARLKLELSEAKREIFKLQEKR